MSNLVERVSTALIQEALRYVEKDPMENMPRLVALAERLVIDPQHRFYLRVFREYLQNPSNNWYRFTEKLFTELSPAAKRAFLVNYLLHSGILGIPKRERLQAELGRHIPWALLLDPTTACNLRCLGCWAAEYAKTDSLSLDLLDRIIREGKELGIFMFLYSGGEPLMRKEDLLTLARRHDDCAFLAFTNATLVDAPFAAELGRLGNLALAISVEGDEETTDARRGAGTYRKALAAMDLLRDEGVVFGFSTCTHRDNAERVASDAFVDSMVRKGCRFGWFFTYIPIGRCAAPELLTTPEQRERMFHRIRAMRREKPIFLMDFWNDGDYVGGCIAGGRKYLHINARGDVEPCAFIHYADANIRDCSLLEALDSPLMREYRKGQPFHPNLLRPCPLLDNPEKLREMIRRSGARSTQPLDEESAETLTAKVEGAAARWAPVADRLWEELRRGTDPGEDAGTG